MDLTQTAANTNDLGSGEEGREKKEERTDFDTRTGPVVKAQICRSILALNSVADQNGLCASKFHLVRGSDPVEAIWQKGMERGKLKMCAKIFAC